MKSGRLSETGQAMALISVSVALFSLMSALAKALGGSYSTVQIVFFRSFFALIPVAVVTLHLGTSSLRMGRPGLMALRVVVGFSAMSTYFFSLTVLPLAEVIALTFAAPLFTAILGILFLGERVGWRRWGAIALGFLGVLVMVRPGSAVFSWWSLLPILSAAFYSTSVIIVRTLSRSESGASIVLYFSLAAFGISALGVPLVWVTPDTRDLLMLVGLGCAGGVLQLCAAAALRRAPVAVLAPFEYTSMLWTALIGYVVWSELPRPNIWVGALTVGFSAAYIAYRESRAARS